ncbi:MAG TPA: FMN-binding protein [Phycisphaerae bacterium]|nr:FMN-binding protein [Phycisphaerae bacterium]
MAQAALAGMVGLVLLVGQGLPPGAGSEPGAAKPPAAAAAVRTKAQADALIDATGRSSPEWWDSVELKYPDTLDLSWPDGKPGDSWQPQRQIGAYLVSVISPNPGRWREGIKLLHHVLAINKDNPVAQRKAIQSLGNAYYDYEGDYARAAFWLSRGNDFGRVKLASCYWKLGARSAAEAILRKIGADTTRDSSVIRLWSEMGDLKTALSLAEKKAQSHWADAAYLAAGDVCRRHGKYDEAMTYYQKAVAVKQGGRDIKRNQERAQAAVESVQVFRRLDLSKVADGTYSGSAQGYRGPVEVQVVVKAGRIESCTVTRHKEDMCFVAPTAVPEQIVARQGVKDVDAVTSATITSTAIINATAKALAAGTKP